MGEDLQPEELAGLETEATHAMSSVHVGASYVHYKNGIASVLVNPEFLLRLVREHRRLQTIEKNYLVLYKAREEWK